MRAADRGCASKGSHDDRHLSTAASKGNSFRSPRRKQSTMVCLHGTLTETTFTIALFHILEFI